MLRHARAHPWPGNKPLDCPHHVLDTTAITEPGRAKSRARIAALVATLRERARPRPVLRPAPEGAA